MPKRILAAIQASEEAAGKSPKEAKRISYATANTRGFMHGPNETVKGARAEAKFARDHGTSAPKMPRKPRNTATREVHAYDWRKEHGRKR